jgi:integrase
LIDAYQSSQEYLRLAQSTRQHFDTMARVLIDRWAWMEIGDIEARSIRDEMLILRDEIAAKGLPHSADKHLAAACRVLSFAYDRGKISFNHGHRMKYLAPTGTRRGISFDTNQQAAVLAAMDADFALAFRLALYTGIRVGDLCRLKWTDLDPQGWLYVNPSKTRKSTNVELWLPTFALPPLAEALASAPRRNPEILTYICRSDKAPGAIKTWQPYEVARRWIGVRSKIGMSHLHWHDLRGTCIQALANCGCTEDEQAAISGHSLGGGRSQLGNYKTVTRQLAERAYRKWAAALEPESKIVAFPR